MAILEGLRRWRNGEVLNARDYVYERDLIVSLLNEHDAALAALEMFADLVEEFGYDGTTLQRIAFSQTPTMVVENPGQIGWNPVDGTFDVGLLNGTTGQMFQETHIYGKANGAIAVGDAVMFAGVQGNHLLLKKAVQAEINANPELFLGISTNDIATGEFGYVTWFGKVNDFPAITHGFVAGDVLWYDSAGSTPGLLTKVRPMNGYAKIRVGVVIKDSQNINQPNTGIAFIRPLIVDKKFGINVYSQTTAPTDLVTGDTWFDIGS